MMVKRMCPSRVRRSVAVGWLGVVAILIGTGVATAQSQAGTWSVPRTAFGQPDLQGVWDFASITPMERPEEFAGQAFMTAEEAAAYEARRFALVDHDTDVGAESVCPGTGNYNEFWYDRGYGTGARVRRTSLVIDPPDGRIPAYTASALARRRAAAEAQRGRGPANSHETLGLGTRCILGFNAGPPMLPSAYNNNVQLFQTPDHVVIFNEMVHDPRVVPLDGRAQLPADVRQLSGDSRGWWDGDTLVVETTNFSGQAGVRGSTDRLRLVERFTRVGPDSLVYRFTVDDPTTFTTSWTAEVPMIRTPGPLYEYACHEGNYGMEGILAGTRAEERAAVR